MMWSWSSPLLALAALISLQQKSSHLFTNSFVLPHQQLGTTTTTAPISLLQKQRVLRASGVGEFSVIDDIGDGDDEEEENTSEQDFVLTHHHQDEEDIPIESLQYAALPLGSATVQIQVGDLALARKAWKKRRRSGSPLLVPCSILNLDRTSMIRSNLMYLLYKNGNAQKDGMVLSLTKLGKLYKKKLNSSLSSHAMDLGYKTPKKMVEALFEGFQDTLGVQIFYEEDKLYLKAPISKFVALKKAERMAILQVTTEHDKPDTMRHTGFIQQQREREGEEKGKVTYECLLSAALRVSQREDVETGRIQNGSFHSAVLSDFDPRGDGGYPLLTLSMKPLRSSKAAKVASRRDGNRQILPKYTPIQNPKFLLDNLQTGKGPFDAKVIKLGKDHALVDFGVGRQFQAKEKQEMSVGAPEFVKVYGRLRFKDAIDPNSSGCAKNDKQSKKQPSSKKKEKDIFADMDELFQKMEASDLEDGEQAEDITHLFEMNESGELTYKNPETGEIEIVSGADDIDEDEEGNEDEADEDTGDAPVTFVNNVSPSEQRKKAKILRLKVGESVPVYVLSVAKQSRQFMVTTDPTLVQGKSAKDIKREEGVSKKMERLSQMLGGLDRAEELIGKEYWGTVKATSQTGDWLYVQPRGENDEELNLPVGVATISAESSAYAQGDRVRIRMEGIDESRGQLAMHVLEKLSP